MTAGIDPGCVRLRLRVDDGRVAAAAVASERPSVGQALRGRAADAAVRLVPLLFALCGQAQGRAATLALAAARGDGCPAGLDPAIQGEALREHLWRWLLDLPALLGLPVMQLEYVCAAAAIQSGRRDELAALLNGPAITDLQRRLVVLDEPAAAAPRLLPPLDARASLDWWPRLDAEFCRLPQWQGAAAETGAIGRQGGTAQALAAPLAARWLARLDELRAWAEGKAQVGAAGTASAVPVVAGAPKRGRALVETARGVLMHEIELDGERIADYLIVAPTEWNFHPQGPLAGWLTGRDATDPETLRAFAARAVAALDPCVRWELEGL